MNIQIKLSDHFTYSKLLRFTLPSIIMMIFTSVYSVVDGLFVSNLVGQNALSAVNIVFPVSMNCRPPALCWAPAAAPWWPAPWGRASPSWPTGIFP